MRDRLMSANIRLNAKTHHLDVVGVVNIDNIVRLRQAGTILIEQIEKPVINLEYMITGDSTVLALLTAWTRDAKKLGKPLHFSKLPPPLFEIAKLSNLDQVLKIS